MKNGSFSFAIAFTALLGGVYTAWPDPPPMYKAMSSTQMAELRARVWKLLPLFGQQTEGRPDPGYWISVEALLPPPPDPDSVKPVSLKVGSKPVLSQLTFAEPLELRDLPSKPATNTASPPVTYEATFYNRKESDSIRTQGLKVPGAVAALLKDEQRDIFFPKGSEALKTFWYVVDDNTTVAYWDWNKIPRNDQLGAVTFDTVCVRLNPAPGSGCLDAKKNFYTLTKDASMTFTKPQSTDPDVQNGQTLILVALHIVSKQMPDWLWGTFWWRGNGALATHGKSWTCADADRDAIKGELAKMPSVWQNYSMDVDASFKIAKPPVDDPTDVKNCGKPGTIGNNEERIAVYSPFVEALLLNGRKSSCIGCHALANTGMAQDGPKVPPLGVADQNLSLPTFELQVRTDYMWKVANRMPKSLFPSNPWPPKP